MHQVQRGSLKVESVVRPATVLQAFEALAKAPDRIPIAGGTDLLLDLQRGPARDGVDLLDLTTITDLHDVEVGEHVTIGALVTHADVLASSELAATAWPLVQACAEVGSPQLRNTATVVGNVVTASPANDTISALLALRAEVGIGSLVSGRVKIHWVALTDFICGFRETSLGPGELVLQLRFPPLGPRHRAVWAKLGNRRAQAISVIHLALVAEVDPSGLIVDAEIALGSAAATVVAVEAVRSELIGKHVSRRHELSTAAGAAASAAVTPIDDVRATANYRKQTIGELTERAVVFALGDEPSTTVPTLPRLGRRDVDTPQHVQRASLRDDDAIELTINGTQVRGARAASLTLLEWIREEAQLDGTKEGCGEGECGACTVHLNGEAVMSCLVSASQALGKTVVTIEGLAGETLHPLQEEFLSQFAVQCGFCTPGLLMAGSALLETEPSPTSAHIGVALSGNLCRCTGYYAIEKAVHLAGVR